MNDKITLSGDLPLRFETNDKYYTLNCYRDMFGDIVVVCDYGGKHSRGGHRKITKVSSIAQAEDTIDHIVKVRYRHGYVMIEGNLL